MNNIFCLQLGLRPRAFISFLVFGNPDETLALVFEIWRPKSTAWQPGFLVRTRHRLFFEFQKKNGKELHLALGEEYLNCLASLRCALHSLKTLSQVFVLFEEFSFWFLLLRLASSSPGNVGNLSFALLLLKRSWEMENKWQIFTEFRLCQLTIRQEVPFTVLTLCFVLIGWFLSLLFFLGFDWLRQTVLFFLNWTACVF